MKWIVTLEITVDAESREEAFTEVENRLIAGTVYMLYDAEVSEDQEAERTRECPL